MSVFAEFAVPVTALSPGTVLSGHPDVTVELERIVPTGSVTHYHWIVGEGRDGVVDALRTDPAVESVDRLDDLTDRVLVRVRWERVESPLFRVLEESGAHLVGATGTGDGWTVDLRFPDQEALAAFYRSCRTGDLSVELLGINRPGSTGADDYGLSTVQRETIAVAVEAGYFDVPRGTTITELADRLGVSEQAVSERLRRGLSNFLSATLGEPARDGSSDGGDDGDGRSPS